MADEIVERTLPPNEQHEWQAKAVAAGWKPPWHDEPGRTPSSEPELCATCFVNPLPPDDPTVFACESCRSGRVSSVEQLLYAANEAEELGDTDAADRLMREAVELAAKEAPDA